jgi:lipoprotein-releasing system permease protein
VVLIEPADPDTEPVSAYGGDAARLADYDDDPVRSSELVRWFIGDREPSLGEPAVTAVNAVDMPIEPSLSRRTQALPGILVGRELVKQTHLYTGQEVRVVSPLSDPSNPDATGTPIPFNRDYRVAGVFYTGMYEYDLKYVYVTLDSLQDFLDRGESVDGIEVRIEDANDTERYVPTEDSNGLIRDALGSGYRIQDWRELNRSLFSALKLEKIAMFLVLGIVILVASFSIVGNLIMVVVEKGREIALLKTLGASDAGVMQLFAIQGLLIGVIGTILGVSFGLVLCWFMKEIGLPLNPDVYYIDRLPVHVDPESVAASAAAGVFISIAATFYPALMAARVRPATGMRH